MTTWHMMTVCDDMITVCDDMITVCDDMMTVCDDMVTEPNSCVPTVLFEPDGAP